MRVSFASTLIHYTFPYNKTDCMSCLLADMSLGSKKSSTINTAVAAAISVGVVVVTSAGNDGFDSCNKSPASVETAITVGSIEQDDSRSSFSNYGSCVDIFA